LPCTAGRSANAGASRRLYGTRQQGRRAARIRQQRGENAAQGLAERRIDVFCARIDGDAQARVA
jgi:hypothetical protein